MRTLVFFVLLAGCAQTEVAGPEPIVHDNHGTGCSELIVLVPISFDHAASVLPDGFAAVDLGQTFGLGADVGQAGAYVFTVHCQSSSWGDGSTLGGVAIGVEGPDFEAHEPADLHFYVFETATDNPAMLDVLDQAGWQTLRTEVTHTRTTIAGSEGGEGAAGDGYTLSVTGRAPSSLTGLSRSWQLTPEGVAHLDYVLEATVAAGQATCSLSGTAATIAGTTTCSQAAVGMVILETDWTGTFRTYPGAAIGA